MTLIFEAEGRSSDAGGDGLHPARLPTAVTPVLPGSKISRCARLSSNVCRLMVSGRPGREQRRDSPQSMVSAWTGGTTSLLSHYHMNDPLSLALREITETRRLLETLITSSEGFDYPKAKVALQELNRKVRDLAKLEGRLGAQLKPSDPKIHVLDFSKSGPIAQV
jgi:hypothetical protein